MKRLAMVMIVLMVSACAAPGPPQWQIDMQQRIKNLKQANEKLWEDKHRFDQKAEAFFDDRDKAIRKEATFLSSMSDAEKAALAALDDAMKGSSETNLLLASRKLNTLLAASGKLSAWLAIQRERDALEGRYEALDKEVTELDKRRARLKRRAEVLLHVYRDTMAFAQQQEMIGALQGINNQLWDMNYNNIMQQH